MEIVDQEDITVIVNTAEDMWLPHGYFSPDIDTVMYTLSGEINEETWYGISGDTFEMHKKLRKAGKETLNIGDLDRMTHIRRGKLLKEGKSLSDAVDIQRKALGIRARVLPMSDDIVETVIVTPQGEMNLHEFLIDYGGRAKVDDIYFKNIENVGAGEAVIDAIEQTERIIIGPSNPVSSILPIVSLKGVDIDRQRSVAISPIICGKPVSGPADKFMQAKGYSPDSVGVGAIYRDLICTLVVDNRENDLEIEGIRIIKTNTIMRSMADKMALARLVVEI